MQEKHAEWLDLAKYANIPIFNTKAVVQQTGIGAPTLRAWERRYKILSPERAQNDYRLYSERDIAIIRWLKDRVDVGMSISQAIALFRHLQEEHNQLQRTNILSETTSLSQMISNDEPKEDEQGNKNASRLAISDVPEPTEELKVPRIYSLHFVQDRLIEAFNNLDEVIANQLMASVMAIYPIEQICSGLITPTLWEIGQLWEQGLITVSIEHFASQFFHGLLLNLFHALPTNNTDPLVIACCAPGEEHELALLMLSLLLRQAGLRVAYLGQSIESKGLLQTVRHLSPALICVSVTLDSFLEAVIELGQKLQALPPPRPVFVFGGQLFQKSPDLIARVPGIYINGEITNSVTQLRRLVFQQVEHHNEPET